MSFSQKSWLPELLRRLVVVILVLLVFLCASSTHRMMAQEKIRDLTRYESIGPYKIRHYDETRKSKQATMRSFLWRHWRAHKLAMASVTYLNTEGDSRKITYFVEPNESGRWLVTIKIDSVRYPRGMRPEPVDESHQSFEACYVDRIKMIKWTYTNPDPDPVPVPVNAKRSPQSFRLMFSDQAGNTISEL
jgi:hypothetical protein